MTTFQGNDTKPNILKQENLRFVSNAVIEPNAMQVGSFEDDGHVGAAAGSMGMYQESESPTEEWGYYDEANAIGHHKGGYWQSPGKGGSWDRKGKGKGKGEERGKGEGKKGKGKGKGPKTGCWNYGGAYHASECPKGKAKGKGKPLQAYGLSEDEYDWEEWSQSSESVGQLSRIQKVGGKGLRIATQNRFQILETEEVGTNEMP